MQSATALGKLGHPDGELNLTRAAAKHGVIQMVRIVHLLYYLLIYLFTRSQRWRPVPSTKLWMLLSPINQCSSNCKAHVVLHLEFC